MKFKIRRESAGVKDYYGKPPTDYKPLTSHIAKSLYLDYTEWVITLNSFKELQLFADYERQKRPCAWNQRGVRLEIVFPKNKQDVGSILIMDKEAESLSWS